MAVLRSADAGGSAPLARVETAVLNSLKLVPVSALAKIDEINQLDFCLVPIKRGAHKISAKTKAG